MMNQQQLPAPSTSSGPSAHQQRTTRGACLPSYTQRIAQRMSRVEAISATVRMMSAYTTCRCTEESILVLAEVLMSFPLEVATGAASPIHGAPKVYRDYPLNAGQLTEWCEQASQTLYRQARFERERLPAPTVQRPTQEQLDAQFERLGLSHLRPGSRFPRRPRFTQAEVQEAQWILDRNMRDLQEYAE